MRNLLNNPRFPDGIQVLKESGKASDLVQRVRVHILGATLASWPETPSLVGESRN